VARLIPAPAVLQAAGEPPKTISEFFGRLASDDDRLSIAVMESPSGWSEPRQRPEFDEYSVVLHGEMVVQTDRGSLVVSAGQAVHVPAGERVRYATPSVTGATYVAVCLPAFSPETVHRDP
jgi:mannose-6-phosphate isomerase-like protein (cupin superfamily)